MISAEYEIRDGVLYVAGTDYAPDLSLMAEQERVRERATSRS